MVTLERCPYDGIKIASSQTEFTIDGMEEAIMYYCSSCNAKYRLVGNGARISVEWSGNTADFCEDSISAHFKVHRKDFILE